MLPRTLVPSTISLIYNPKGELLQNPYASNIHPIHPHRANYITDLIGVPKSFIQSTAANSLGAEKRKIRRAPRSPYAWPTEFRSWSERSAQPSDCTPCRWMGRDWLKIQTPCRVLWFRRHDVIRTKHFDRHCSFTQAECHNWTPVSIEVFVIKLSTEYFPISYYRMQ